MASIDTADPRDNGVVQAVSVVLFLRANDNTHRGLGFEWNDTGC